MLLFPPDFYCLPRISLNNLVFTIRRQLVDRKPEPTPLLTHGIFNLPHHIDMVREQLTFGDAVSYTQWWKFKLAGVMAWGIEPLTFRLGVLFQKKVRHPNHSATEDAMPLAYGFCVHSDNLLLHMGSVCTVASCVIGFVCTVAACVNYGFCVHSGSLVIHMGFVCTVPVFLTHGFCVHSSSMSFIWALSAE